MRAVSAKRARENRIRARLRAGLIEANGPLICARCERLADDLHEPGKRSQGADPTDPEQVIPLCRACHDHIHTHVAESVAAGWLKSRKDVHLPEGTP